MSLISVIINCDTRTGFKESESHSTQMFDGCRSLDFLIDGVQNKINFFEGYEKEIILFIDEHERIPEDVVKQIRGMVDTLIIRKHTSEPKFNDLNYLCALQMARGEYVVHFDQDCAAFARNGATAKFLMALLETYNFISYPSKDCPKAVDDKSFDYMWISTRFFMCKRKSLDFTEIRKCLDDYDYTYFKYPASRKCHWFEHILGLISEYNGTGVFYPSLNTDEYAIFCWNKYISGTLRVLNAMNYDNVKNYIESCNGIVYPCDVTATKI